MSPVEFGDLPSSSHGTRNEHTDIAEQLRSNPNSWAKVSTRPTISTAAGVAHRIRNGLLVAYRPAGYFEATTRGTDVWARYIGDAS